MTAQVDEPINEPVNRPWGSFSFIIPMGEKHRLKNRDKEEPIFIEVQNGTYVGEDDIKRYEDDYGRAVE